MPIHDWTRVDAGILHHFYQRWIVAITDVLNDHLLPPDYYALAEQHGAGFEPDVLTLKASSGAADEPAEPPPAPGGLLVAEPRVRLTATTDLEFYRRRQTAVAVRHASGDRLVAVVGWSRRATNPAGRRSTTSSARSRSC